MKTLIKKNITLKEFESFYFTGDEQKQLCKLLSIPHIGSKLEVKERIIEYLKTGNVIQPKPKVKHKPYKEDEVITRSTIIQPGHKCSQKVRAFFEAEIPGFHFSTHIQNFFKNNPGLTYEHAIEEWYKEKEEKKSRVKQPIGKQFEFNIFIREFYSKPENAGKSRKEAIKMWEEYKKSPKPAK